MVSNCRFPFAALLFLTAASPQWAQSPQEQARALAVIGHNQLHLARLSDAVASCDQALKLDPANDIAKDCLDRAASMRIDQDLNNAENKLVTGDKSGAIALASQWTDGAGSASQHARAKTILQKASPTALSAIVHLLVPAWLREILVTIFILTAMALILQAGRVLWREWKRGEWYGSLTNITKWTMLPLKEFPADAGNQTGIATDALLDALARVGHELRQPLWKPHLLMLRPTPPASYEPAIISDFLSDAMPTIVIAPPADDLCLEWSLHDVRLDDAVQNLQLKAAAGLDIGSVARFLASIVRWFNAGAPVISGIAATEAGKSVSIHLAAHGGRIQSAAVTASTNIAPGIDATELSAEQVAFKFLFRMRYPDMTDDQIDGFSALREGATLFAQYAGTVPGVGDDARSRNSSLAKAAADMSFFRASIPVHSDPGAASNLRSSLQITDDVRQAVLLAEGVAHALVGTERDLMHAVDCFRQLQDWPGSPETVSLRQQAAYNEALVWAQTGTYARAVLMLTELLGERAPDTIANSDDPMFSLWDTKTTLPEAIRFPARVARVAAFSRYDPEAWTTVPECRMALIGDDAEELVKDLDKVCGHGGTSARDHRLLRYLYVEALRAIGHLELMRVVHGSAASVYENKRPTGLRRSDVSEEASGRLHRAISYLLTCEQLAPGSSLYCDLAESYLLLKDFTAAEGYARHAILESNPPSERAYYLAAESFSLENTRHSIDLAKRYAAAFPGTVTLDEFKAVRAELEITDGAPRIATAGRPV